MTLTVDMVNSPPHYQTDSGLEAIDVIEAFFRENYHLGAAFKYLARCGKKDAPVQELEKARWYISREIARLGGDTKPDKSDATAISTESPNRWTYEYFGKVRDISVTSEFGYGQEFAVDLVSTMASSASHSIKFTADSDNSGVADLWLGKPERPAPEGAYTTEAPTGFKVGDRVRITSTSDEYEVQVGTIARIKCGPDFDGDYEITYPDDWDYVPADMLELASEPKVGDLLTITSITGHGFPVDTPVKVVRLRGWDADRDDYPLCEDSGGLRQALPISDTNW